MRSNNNFVNKLYDQLVDRRNRLEAKRLELRAKISDRYPDEMYGVKGKILALTRRGWNTKAIAADCKCSTQTVRNWQKRFKEEGMLDMTMEGWRG